MSSKLASYLDLAALAASSIPTQLQGPKKLQSTLDQKHWKKKKAKKKLTKKLNKLNRRKSK